MTPVPLALRVQTQDATTVTLEWDPVPGSDFYRGCASNQVRPAVTPNTSIKFAKGSSIYWVEAVQVLAFGTYP